MEFIDILGLVAGICTSSSILPQLIKTIKTKKTENVSIAMFIVMLSGNALWIYYGFDKSDIAIISTNFLALGLNIAILIAHFKYKSADNH
jgi:MtN3 and saliva related transmembrane protein